MADTQKEITPSQYFDYLKRAKNTLSLQKSVFYGSNPRFHIYHFSKLINKETMARQFGIGEFVESNDFVTLVEEYSHQEVGHLHIQEINMIPSPFFEYLPKEFYHFKYYEIVSWGIDRHLINDLMFIFNHVSATCAYFNRTVFVWTEHHGNELIFYPIYECKDIRLIKDYEAAIITSI